MTTPARYRFSDGARVGVLLGMSIRQALPIVVGVLWLTLMLMVDLPVLGMVGPVAGTIVALGRWKRAPLYEVAAPGARLMVARMRKRSTWHRRSLLAAGPGFDTDLPEPLRGLELHDVTIAWHPVQHVVGIVHDRQSGTVSMVLPVRSEGFPVASPTEQDALVASWGAVLAPIARARCPISRVTWQEWSHPIGVDGHRSFLEGAGRERNHEAANGDYDTLLAAVAPFTIAHEVLLTVTVDLRLVRARKGASSFASAVDALAEETRQLVSRSEAAGFDTEPPLTPAELSTAIRLRSDPTRAGASGAVRRSLASAAGKGAAEWGAHGRRVELVRDADRRLVASIVSLRHMAHAAGRCRLDEPAADRRQRDTHGHRGARTRTACSRSARCEPATDLDRG
ncbi:MAG: SCO6880 family protein [Actinomycetota bacterium]